MATFEISKFDPANDPHCPIVGTVIDHNGKKFKIVEVEYIQAGDLLKSIMNKEPVDLRGHTELMIFDHPDRPFVKYQVWVDEVV